MNLKNNEFVVSMASHTELDVPYLYVVTNFGRLFYLVISVGGSSWKETISG